MSEASATEVTLVDHHELGPIVVVRRGETIRAWRDLCPHQWLPLSYRNPQILSADGTRLRCSNHGAEFSADDGRPVDGGLPCGLEPVPVDLDAEGRVVLRPEA